MSERLILTAALVTSAAILAIGCGGGDGSDEGADPAQVTEDFFNAVAAGDGETACGLLSDEGLENIPEDPEGCPDEVASLSEEDRAKFAPSNVEQVTGETEHCGTIEESETDAETVATVNGDVECVNLSLIDGEWKINDT
ncbi:MAG TPA: hypothetical protein VEK39_01150 [Solirubrobacterales bacterium]|nr:hypothetical protein [Solirubrobacterales bacterium]